MQTLDGGKEELNLTQKLVEQLEKLYAELNKNLAKVDWTMEITRNVMHHRSGILGSGTSSSATYFNHGDIILNRSNNW